MTGRRMILTCLLLSSCQGTLAPPADVPAPVPGAYETFLCPECARICGPELPACEEGGCRICRRPVIPVRGTTRAWWWCAARDAWREEPCDRTGRDRCCSERRSTALVVPLNAPDVLPGGYCPEDRRCIGTDWPVDRDGRCLGCGRPPVTAETVTRRWFRPPWDPLWDEFPEWRERDGRREGVIATVLACPIGPPEPLLYASSLDPPLPSGRPAMLVTTEWLEARLAWEQMSVLHVGFDSAVPGNAGRERYGEGHIPGAREVRWREVCAPAGGGAGALPPLAELSELARRLGLHGGRRIVLYDTGAGFEAARAYLALEYLGLSRRASLLDGHWRKWRAEGRSVSAATPRAAAPSSYVPRPRPDAVVHREAMEDLAWVAGVSPSTVRVLDARPEEEFRKEDGESDGWRSGLVPGAANLPALRCVEGEGSPVLRPFGELHALFRDAGVRPGMLVVVCGRSEGEAALVWFAARRLGYDPLLYDGPLGGRDRVLPSGGFRGPEK